MYLDAGFEHSNSVDLFFNSLQIYESVMSLAFVLFEENPHILNSLNDLVQKAFSKLQKNRSNKCLTGLVICAGAATIAAQFDSILASFDSKLGELGLVKIAEFVADIVEIFCQLFHIDVTDTNKIENLSKSIQEKISFLSGSLKFVFGETLPVLERANKWGPLGITQQIRSKLSKFERQSELVNRTLTSFESLFKEIEKIDHVFEIDNSLSESSELIINETKLETKNQLDLIGRFFQDLDTILNYGILLFKNEADLLNPLLDQVDESTRILKKFFSLHPLYKLICGKNYLCKINQIINNIVQLLLSSNLKINTPHEFINELQEKYPNLIFLLGETILQDGVKFLPNDVKKLLGNLFDQPLSNLKNVDITNPNAIGSAIGKVAGDTAKNIFKFF